MWEKLMKKGVWGENLQSGACEGKAGPADK